MSNLESLTHEQGVALSRHFAKQQLWNSLAMLLSAILAYLLFRSMPMVVDGLAFATAAATAFTVGMCCSPNTYRTRSGSLSTAMFLMAFMWAMPMAIFVFALWG